MHEFTKTAPVIGVLAAPYPTHAEGELSAGVTLTVASYRRFQKGLESPATPGRHR